MTLTINGMTGRSHIDGTLVQRRDINGTMDTRMVGCDRGAGDIIEDISPLFSSPICLDGNRRKTHSIHSIGDVKLVG